MNILVFGDSIAWGAFDYMNGGWVDILKKDLYPDHFVYNLGISGDTAEYVADRIVNETLARSGDDECICIIAIGVNDASYTDGKRTTDPNSFASDVLQIIKETKRLSHYFVETIFIGLTLVDEKRTHPVAWDKNLTYSNEDILKYNSIVKEICTQQNIKFIDIYEYLSPEETTDGVHLNESSHNYIADEVLEVINPILEKNKEEQEDLENK